MAFFLESCWGKMSPSVYEGRDGRGCTGASGCPEDGVRAAALSEAGKHSALWCLGRLLPQYALYRQTCESRYGEEITRLVRGLLKVITEDPGGGPSVQHVATVILDRLQILHEQLGLP